MFVVRPVETRDISALVSLGASVRPGVHTLPRTLPAVEHAVQRSLVSFAARVDIPSEEAYFFVLESTDDGSVIGAAAITATAGAGGTFFAFRNDVIQQVSRDLDISHSVHVLTLCSDLSAYSQLSGFYAHDRCQAGRQAELLSRARLLFA
ncbi:MAG TPA: arginine N-succinyltransferase, partial [Herbaspirillum sp.]|nr:arginine N-succinyltransferase [Herbaspirillum sp.]